MGAPAPRARKNSNNGETSPRETTPRKQREYNRDSNNNFQSGDYKQNKPLPQRQNRRNQQKVWANHNYGSTQLQPCTEAAVLYLRRPDIQHCSSRSTSDGKHAAIHTDDVSVSTWFYHPFFVLQITVSTSKSKRFLGSCFSHLVILKSSTIRLCEKLYIHASKFWYHGKCMSNGYVGIFVHRVRI